MTNTDIKQRRKALGLTQTELAEKVEVSVSTISRWESGFIKDIKQSDIVRLARALEMEPIEILELPQAEMLNNDEVGLLALFRSANQYEKDYVVSFLKDCLLHKDGGQK